MRDYDEKSVNSERALAPRPPSPITSRVSVAQFRQKLLDGLSIILREPSICDQFDNLHKKGVPIVTAQTPHRDVQHFLCSQFILGVLAVLTRDKHSWAADHPVLVFEKHA
jgi:hypothetical protein